MSIELENEISTTTKVEIPNNWSVIIFNDEVTPIVFVVELLVSVFHHNEDKADLITMDVHQNGSGIAGSYPREMAEQKLYEAVNFIKDTGMRLRMDIRENK
jgi:ATP-dependent Clp protease adaptor protein ClpS